VTCCERFSDPIILWRRAIANGLSSIPAASAFSFGVGNGGAVASVIIHDVAAPVKSVCLGQVLVGWRCSGAGWRAWCCLRFYDGAYGGGSGGGWLWPSPWSPSSALVASYGSN